jgi:hypothetical protein
MTCKTWACIALAIAGFVGLAMDAGIASAQPIIGRSRWCVTLPHGGFYQCSYHSLEQCMLYARGVSNECSLNSWYEEPPPRPRKRDRR